MLNLLIFEHANNAVAFLSLLYFVYKQVLIIIQFEVGVFPIDQLKI